MRKWSLFLCLCAILLVMKTSSCCEAQISAYATVSRQSITLRTYSLEDFSSIVPGKSTIMDVDKIVPTFSICASSSCTGMSYFPASGGDYICIKYYGSDLVVGAIAVHPNQVDFLAACQDDALRDAHTEKIFFLDADPCYTGTATPSSADLRIASGSKIGPSPK